MKQFFYGENIIVAEQGNRDVARGGGQGEQCILTINFGYFAIFLLTRTIIKGGYRGGASLPPEILMLKIFSI